MKTRLAVLALALGACSDVPVAPTATPPAPQVQPSAAAAKGSGLTLDVVPNVTLPFGLGGPLTVNQAVIENFAVVEDVVGTIVGVRVTGTLSGTQVDALGTLVGVEAVPFVADLNVTSSGPGQCSLVTLDLSSINIDGLGIIDAHIPVNVQAKGSGAVGSLLCALGRALSGLGGGTQGIVNALNNQIG